jgi:YfiH family protein
MIKGDATEKSSKFRDRAHRPHAKRQPWLRAPARIAMTLPPPDAAFHWSREPWGMALRCHALEPHAQHVFTSKQLALPDSQSWLHALASVGATPNRLMRVKQIHGNAVRVLKRGQVAVGAADQRPDGDAIVSDEPGLALAVIVADCVPVLLVDQRLGAAAAVHAGWRGTCARVVVAAVHAMQREFNSRPADLLAAIGPSVGPEEYEVGESVVDAFEKAGHDGRDRDRWFQPSVSKFHLDLWRANADQLAASGVVADHIYICRLSTAAHPDVFASYRVAGDRAGRMAGLIVVPRPA